MYVDGLLFIFGFVVDRDLSCQREQLLLYWKILIML